MLSAIKLAYFFYFINKKLKNALKETKAMFKKGKIGILAPFLNMHPEWPPLASPTGISLPGQGLFQ